MREKSVNLRTNIPWRTFQLEFWSTQVLEGVEYRIYDITYPHGQNAQEWKKLFKPCASQRLFLPVSWLERYLIQSNYDKRQALQCLFLPVSWL